MSLVLDTSATLAWVYPDETMPPIREVFHQVEESGAWVPSLWKLEIANLLETGVRRHRHSTDFRDVSLADLALLPIQVDLDTHKHAWGATLRLAERHRMTVNDAAYLELALRLGLPLATLDQELRSAARSEKVHLLGA